MRILMTTDTAGGVWNYCMELCRALDSHGARIFLVAKGVPSADQIDAAESLESVTLFAGNFKLEWMDGPWDDLQKAGDWLLALADAVEPDLIHLNDYCHGVLPWDTPVLMVGHSCVLSWMQAVHQQEPDRKWDRYRAEVTRGLHAADLVVAPTRHMLGSLKRHYGPLRNCQVISNGCAPVASHSVHKQSHIFSAGRLWDEAKNLRTLSAAAPRLRWPVRIAGLPHPETGHDGADTARDGLIWLGRLDSAQMAAAYAEAGVYALPAVYEPFGLTVLEAAQAACALVLGDIPTLRENWDGAALFVPPREVDQLVCAVNALCENEALRLQLARRARERARRFTACRMAEAYARCYCRLLQRGRSTAVA